MAKIDLSKQGLEAPTDKLVPTQPKPEEFKGQYKHNDDGFVYELAPELSEKDFSGERDRKTHRLRVRAQTNDAGETTHPGLYWEGSKEEFKKTFDVVKAG